MDLESAIDKATGLILGDAELTTENKLRLQNNLLYYNSGTRLGEPVKEDNLIQDFVTIGDSDAVYAKRKHAPGLIYRWKRGIITATRNINLRSSLRGERSEIDRIRRDVGITVTKDPFANLDIADVISLLVTGVPHNYESFFTNAQSVGSFTTTGSNSPESFFHSFFDITRSTNRALGNFQPFKTIQISRDQMAKRLSLQTELTEDNNEIKQLQSEIAILQVRANPLPADSEARKRLENVIEGLSNSLSDKTLEFTETIKNNKDTGLRVYGDDIIFDSSTDTSESVGASKKAAGENAKLRSKIMQFRPQLNTKFNTDTNLFIVSDEYDKDLDLQAFAINLASGEIPIWNSQYKHPKDICINAAKVMDLEFFCDTQGHIQLRPPKYNKLPMSLLVKMLLLSEQKKIDLMPPFVRALFKSRAESLNETSKVLETEIKIINLLLFGRSGVITNLATTADTATSFLTVGRVISGDSIERGGSVTDEIRRLRNVLAEKSGTSSVLNDSESVTAISNEITALQDPNAPNVNTNRVAQFNRLLQLTSQKQRVDETREKIVNSKTQQAFDTVVKDTSKGFGTTLNVGQMSEILEPFGDLIEDDFNDFLGPGSSKRFIIHDDQILSYEFRESDKNVTCRVDVTGQEDLLGGTPGEIGGVPLIWAGATDFDLWKQYGWRANNAINKPFFKDGDTQCAPYALMLLTRQRRDTVRGSVTLVGNEYYQLGDVVYINHRDMLYYVYGVSHRFSYSGTFTTTLDLRYGHPLGEFIPTPLDVIGKNLIKNQRKFNTTFMSRTTAGTDIGRSAGIVLFGAPSEDPESTSEDAISKKMLEGDLGFVNLQELKNSLLRINIHKDRIDGVEIRGYKTNIGLEVKSTLIRKRMRVVKDWLEKSPISSYTSDGNTIQLDPRDFPAIPKGVIDDISIDVDPIIITDISKENQEKKKGRTPSEEAYNVSLDGNPANVIEIVLIFKKKES